MKYSWIADMADGTRIVCERESRQGVNREGKWQTTEGEWQCFQPDHQHLIANSDEVSRKLEKLWETKFLKQLLTAPGRMTPEEYEQYKVRSQRSEQSARYAEALRRFDPEAAKRRSEAIYKQRAAERVAQRAAAKTQTMAATGRML